MSAIQAQLSVDAVNYHASLAAGWENRYRKHAFQLRQTVLRKCLEGRNISGHLWLDAGCGTGTLSRWLAARGCGVLGVDAASEMIAAAAYAAQAQEYSERLSFVRVSTVARLALDDEILDGVLCSSVLEYVSDPGACLSEFARVLKPGGLLLVSIPNRNSVVRRVQAACHRLGGFVGQGWAKFMDYSRHEYSRREFERVLSRAGFSSEKLVSFGSPLPSLAQRSQSWAPLMMFVAQKPI
jgi:2-polyprenyl-6-hydroxyphenyl methylase/3-demethylubiquinone-9 3-methyltransferase